MKLPRWLHHLYAWALGYFWIPCPKCGRMFGGHEAREGHATREGKVTCPRCPAPLVRLTWGGLKREPLMIFVEGEPEDAAAWDSAWRSIR